MFVICLTGGIGSGKSTAAKYLATLGAHIIDADKLGHEAYMPGTRAYKEIVKTFGEDILADNHQIDRRILGGKVFGQAEELTKLTDIVWPEIRAMAESAFKKVNSAHADAIIIFEAAVLIEAGWDDLGDEVWVVTVERQTALQRCMTRDGLTQEAIENRLNAQLSNEDRISKADQVISNDDSQERLKASLEQQWARVVTR
ncbi:MAG TPA: dephospho-CoA kinase [Gammaproteobacteria bacterium]|nr:dephospho-CoA kinase [Gammaproteobacteria bacterium]HIK69099.1 dephospho-CoA kinase [Pseudomonadales bacterium]